MKCEKCHKRIGKQHEFCPHCGEKIIRVEKVISNKPPFQLLKRIMIVFLTVAAIVNSIVLIMIAKFDMQRVVDVIMHNDILLVINIITIFIPVFVAAIISVIGWYAIVLSNIIAIILSLLTMIKATKTKKRILIILILIFITISIVALCINPNK